MYGPATSGRASFLANQVVTASPATLLTMLYDRLLLDLHRAEAAQRRGDRSTAHSHLTHAQDIVGELLFTLNVDQWEGGPRLASLYSYLLTEMIGANVACDPERTATIRSHIEPLHEAWHEAAGAVAAAVPASTVA